jgi:superfamily II DNA or RNA helicase
MSLFPLRPYQQSALDQLKWAIVGGAKRPMLQLPTGAGKTVLAAHIVAGALAKGKRVAFCVPAISLIDQTYDRFVQNGIAPGDMGVMQGSHALGNASAPIQICTGQTLERRELPEADVVVIDEAHVLRKVYRAWMRDHLMADKIFVGLSATPYAKELGLYFDALLKPVSIEELIELGSLSPFKVWAPSHPDLKGVKIVKGDYDVEELGKRMSEKTLVADIVSTWLAKGNNEPTLCFAVNVAHSELLAAQFVAHGVPAASIKAETEMEERHAIHRALASGEIKVVCNVGTLTTGIDWDVRCLILARPTWSEMLFQQIIGRALRPAPGKAFAAILDHSDTHLNLGLVTEIDHDTLDVGTKSERKKKTKERRMPLPRECGACAGIIPALERQCPCCGSIASKPTHVRNVDGSLSELTSDGRGAPLGGVGSLMVKKGRQQAFSELLGHARKFNQKDGVAFHKYVKLFGKQPRGLEKVPIPPSPETVAFMRQEYQEWKKSQNKAGA